MQAMPPQMHPPPPHPYLGHHQLQFAPTGRVMPPPPQLMPYLAGSNISCGPPPPHQMPPMMPRRKNATRETTQLLKIWLNENSSNPYPTKNEKIFFAVVAQMSMTQVSTWFANARRRLKKENKMTWVPRNRCDDDDDDEDNNDDDEDNASERSSSNSSSSSEEDDSHCHQALSPAAMSPPVKQQHQQQMQQAPNFAHMFQHPLLPLMAAHHAAMQAAAVAAAHEQTERQRATSELSFATKRSFECDEQPADMKRHKGSPIWRPFD